MSKSRVCLLVFCLVVIGAFALFLWSGTETRLGNWVFDNPVTPAILFFIFFGAVAGVLKIFVDALIPNRMSVGESKRWGRTRKRGKLGFILNALLLSGIPLLVLLAAQAISFSASGEVVRNFAILAVVLLCGIAAIANSIWNYRESHYLKASEGEKLQPNR